MLSVLMVSLLQIWYSCPDLRVRTVPVPDLLLRLPADSRTTTFSPEGRLYQVCLLPFSACSPS